MSPAFVVQLDLMKTKQIHCNGPIRSSGRGNSSDGLPGAELVGQNRFHGGLAGASRVDQSTINIKQQYVHRCIKILSIAGSGADRSVRSAELAIRGLRGQPL